MASNSNRGVVYIKPGSVEVQNIDFPSFRNPAGKAIDHGVILKVVTTNICGSDQHMVRGRTTAPAGMVLGHEITGEVIEKGRDVEYLKVGDLVSVPFNVACGRCRACRHGDTNVCMTVNPGLPGGAYGYVDMGGWIGGQAKYVMVPYADFNLLKLGDRDRALVDRAHEREQPSPLVGVGEGVDGVERRPGRMAVVDVGHEGHVAKAGQMLGHVAVSGT